jgi:hypothetical protein
MGVEHKAPREMIQALSQIPSPEAMLQMTKLCIM